MKTNADFLVILQDFVVASDIAEIIPTCGVEGEVMVPDDHDHALSWLETASNLAWAIVEMGPKEFATSPLYRAIAPLGARVVLFGDEAERAAGEGASDYEVLQTPFTSKDVCRVICHPGNLPEQA